MKITVESKRGMVSFRADETVADKLAQIQIKLKITKTEAIKQSINMLFDELEKKRK